MLCVLRSFLHLLAHALMTHARAASLSQHVLRFCAAFFAADAAAAGSSAADDAAAAEAEAAAAAAATFFQAADIRALALRVDYRPRCAVDAAALAAHGGAAVLHAVPWGGVALSLPRVQLGGVPGWSGLAGALAGAWRDDVAARQAHKLLRGVPGVRQAAAAGAGAANLLTAPLETLRAERPRLRGAARGALAVRAPSCDDARVHVC